MLRFIQRSSCSYRLPISSFLVHSHLKPAIQRCIPRKHLWQHQLQPRRSVHLGLSDAQRSTIYALSTPPGKGGVGIIRISGPDALKVWDAMVKPVSTRKEELQPAPWRLQRCHIVNPLTRDIIDDGLAVYFKGPRSFTSEDVVELHLHSGRAVVAAALSALSTLPTCRPAAAGEFTRRAFLNGRLDLTQVEGLKDLIDAETEGQRRIALQAAEGAVREKFDELRGKIVSALAKVEALIDFGEGEEIEEGVYAEATLQVEEVLRSIRGYLNDHRRGELLRSGIRLAIFGPPNAGKSSLLNFLAQREAAIVTSIPGTTRDILELSLDIGGLPVILADTAGLRKTQDVVEQIGVDRARKAVKNADVSICVLSLPDIDIALSATAEKRGRVAGSPKAPSHTTDWQELITPKTYFLFNKSDLAPSSESAPSKLRNALFKDDISAPDSESPIGEERAWIASLATGEGADAFLAGFADALKAEFGLAEDLDQANQSPIITRARHRENLENAARFLEAFLEYGPEDVVFAAEELRYAANAVGKVTGAISVEDVLDAVFRDFCIGK